MLRAPWATSRGTWRVPSDPTARLLRSTATSLHLFWACSVPPWWRHQMEFPAQRPVTRSFGVFFDLHLNKHLSTQSWGWWFETPLRSLWCHCNVSVELTEDTPSQWTHDVIITSLLRKNDVSVSFWHNNDVMIASRVGWDISLYISLVPYLPYVLSLPLTYFIVLHYQQYIESWLHCLVKLFLGPVSLTVFPSQFKFDGNFDSLSPRF